MSLNPVQFGKDVIDQFGRYLLTTFPIADERLARQVRDKLRHTIGSESLLYKGPYVYLNRPFEPGPLIDDLVQDGTLHRAAASVFGYPSLHWHQAEALCTIQDNQHVILSTGTGSGKTEAFMLPIADYCLRLRDRNAPEGVVALLVYPMNALVNDQLERLRMTLAGTRITFGRYTGETPDQPDPNMRHVAAPVNYSPGQRERYRLGQSVFGSEDLPLPWEEAYDRESILKRRPRILLTNYAQLEYMLLRNKDLDLLRNAPLHFMVFDEVHTYTGALGSEVACLIRRLRAVTGKSPEDVVMIGTSATVGSSNDEQIDIESATRRFAQRLFGVPEKQLMVIREAYRELDWGDTFLPSLPGDMADLLDAILKETRALQLQNDIEDQDISARLVELTAYLCDQQPPEVENPMGQLAEMLRRNTCIATLTRVFTHPLTWDEALPRWRHLGGGRESASDEILIAEMLAYLTIGALVTVDGDPLIRPKLHYFVQGLQGLGIQFMAGHDPQITFEGTEEVMPLLLCRSCGQHYTRLVVGSWQSSKHSQFGFRESRLATRFEELDEDGEFNWLYLTHNFHSESDEDDDRGAWQKVYLCPACNTIHEKHEPTCLNPRCHAQRELVMLWAWEGVPKRCGACGGPNTEKTRLISYTRSSEVADVTILAQSMLTMMTEPSLRKLLIFADSRQEAAFQAGWMQQRARRFRMRHLAFQLVQEVAQSIHPQWGWNRFAEEIVSRAQDVGILKRSDFDNRDQQTEIHWFLIEEFASTIQRRSNLEQLGLTGVVYGGLETAEDAFFQEWASQLNTTPEGIRDGVITILDTFRRRGMLSDPLLARYWSDQDVEVQRSLVSIPDFYRPTALTLERNVQSPYLKGWLASNGRSSAQVIVEQGFECSNALRDRFLKALWHWLVDNQYLVPVELVQRRRGTISAIHGLPDEVYQVNVNRIGLVEVTQRFVCTHCHRAQQVQLPSGVCPEYHCKGHVEEQPRDYEHFDVVQYTMHEFVPLVAREHSAQVSQKRRLEAEREFKSEKGRINTIVATPTLEMGVDIGKLEMVMMRNIPPSPANYAQRAGRAGRRHRIAAVFAYAGGSQHDRYFFTTPPEMISGAVRVPAFSMRNEPLIRKHVHSATLTVLRDLVNVEDQKVLEQTFPAYIKSYLSTTQKDDGISRLQFLDSPPKVKDFANLLQRNRPVILAQLQRIFGQFWPGEDQDAVTLDVLEQYLDDCPTYLQRHIESLFAQFRAYRQALAHLREIEERNQGLTLEEKKQRQRFEQGRDHYLKDEMNNYTLSWLASDGFFPGYALSRESVQASSLQPLLDLSRPATTALRELTPANWVYVDGNVFRVQRLNFGKLKAQNDRFSPDMLREELAYNVSLKRIFDPRTAVFEGGEHELQQIISYRLTDVEMELNQSIDDRREMRRRVAFNILGFLLGQHNGGKQGFVGEVYLRYLYQETVRLVNLGPTRLGPAQIKGFPMCPVCGETRSPHSTNEEIQRFREVHRNQCKTTDILFTALHVDILSDVLTIGPYAKRDSAVNLYEGLLLGANLVLDMNASDLDGFVNVDEYGGHWAVLYDPLPGGSGFLRQILEYWSTICQRAIEALQACDCQSACYKCLQHFHNQQHHPILSRHDAVELLSQLNVPIQVQHTIAPVMDTLSNPNVIDAVESPAEARFLKILNQRSMPLPTSSQFRVDLNNGNYTVADFAWPERRILVFIDGTSPHLHGDPQRAQNDRTKRFQARTLSWKVIEITTQELSDEVSMAYKLDELTYYLNDV